jgi:DNA-binding SARP family transcriptional activator
VYRLSLFGEPTLRGPDGRALATGPVATALLALLARAPGRTLGRGRIASALWADADPAAGRRALRQLLFRIRGEAPDLLVAGRDQVAFNDDRVSIDVVAFEDALRSGRHADAASLYRAPFLHGFTLTGCDDFDPWLDGERERLQRLAAGALEVLADDAAGRGAWHDALDVARRWLDGDPWSEAAARHIIVATAQAAGPAAALAEWSAFSDRLRQELGTEPSEALRRLAARLRREEGALGTMASRATQAAAKPTLPVELPFVGRETEWSRLGECWRRAARGRRGVVVLRGEAGIGKTRLATEMAQWTGRTGATVLSARAWEVEAGVPYATLAGLLRTALRAPGLAGVEDRALVELGRIVPALAERFPSLDAAAGIDLETGALRIMDAWRDLLDSLAHEAPVLLFIDDLPWCDEATIAALHYAWRTLGDVPVMLLATGRGSTAAELGGAAAFLTAASRDEPAACALLDLPPLHEDAVARLAERALAEARSAGRSDVVIDVHDLERRSGGNPLFLAELLRAAAEEGSTAVPTDTIRMAALDRIAALDGDAQGLLQAAAVIGRQFALPLAGTVAGLDSDAAARAVDLLVSRRILRQLGYGYDFVHDILREAVLHHTGAATRQRLHARTFHTLQPQPYEEDDVGSERAGALATHAAAAGLRQEAFRWNLRAARAAVALYAPAEAARALGHALEHADSSGQQREAWHAVAELARIRADFRSAAWAFQKAWEHEPDPALRLRLRMRMLHTGERAGVFTAAEVEDLAGELRQEAVAAGDEAVGELDFICADAAARAGELARSAAYAASASAALRAAHAPHALVRALLLQAGIAGRSGSGSCIHLLDEAAAVATSHGLSSELFDVRVEHANELSRLGHWDEALAGFDAVVADASRCGEFSNIPIARLNAADLRARRGEWDAAGDELRELERICQRYDFPHVGAAAKLNAALLEWLRGDGAAARTHAADARRQAEATGLAAPATVAAAIEALCLISDGELDGAAALLERAPRGAVGHATWSDDAELLVAARARLEAARGDATGALGSLRAARSRMREPYASAFLALEEAELLQFRSRSGAAALAGAALEQATALGARPLVERAATIVARSVD